MSSLEVLSQYGIHLPEGESDWTNRNVQLDPALSLILLNECKFVRQRTARRNRIVQYTNEIKRGTFRPRSIIEIAVLDGKVYLIDGQHRCRGVVEANAPISVKVEVIRIETEEELNQLYMDRDSGIPRTKTDVIRASGMLESSGLAETRVAAIGAAATCIVNRWMKSSTDKSNTIYMKTLNLWLPYGEMFNEGMVDINCQIRNYLERAPVLAVILQTFRYQPEKAREFWGTVSRDDGLRRNTPEKTLLDFLRASRVQTYKTSRHYASYVGVAWNAFYEGKELSKLYPSRDDVPKIFLAGTPFSSDEESMRFHRAEVYGESSTEDEDWRGTAGKFVKGHRINRPQVEDAPIKVSTKGLMPW